MGVFCTGCGNEVAEHMAFCTTCGAAVPDRPASPPPPPPPVVAVGTTPDDDGSLATQLLGSTGPDGTAGADTPDPTDPTDPTDAVPAPAPPGRLGAWLRTRRFQILSRSFLALALLGCGILLGWLWASDRSLVESDLDAPVAEKAAEQTDAVSVTMPDLRGLTTQQAEQVLADAGVPAARIDLVDQPAAGTPGIVIGQEPVYGQAVTGKVTITGSTAAKVPQIRGRSAKAVLDELDEFGAEVRSVSRYVPGAKVGSVVRIKPAPGTLLPVAVTVTIAAEPGELALSSVESEDWSCSSGDDQMNGKAYVGLISCSAYDEPQTSAWLINRAANRLTATIGIPDSSGTGNDRAHLVIRGDGRVLGSYDVAYGKTQDIDVDVTGVLRLTLEYSSPDDDGSAVGLGNANLLGDQDKLDPLESDQ